MNGGKKGESPALVPENVHQGFLILVNAGHPLTGGFGQPEEAGRLVSLTPSAAGKAGAAGKPEPSSSPEILLDAAAAKQLAAALAAIGAGEEIVPVSGFRSRREQEQIYRDSLRESGREFTEKFVALPGASEHQTGLAIDLGENKPPIDFICPAFPDEGICQSFRQAAPDFGFIERYRAGKEGVTGIAREPWHFRYVGYPHSRIITDKGLALEEYLEYLRWFSPDKPLVYPAGEGRGNYEISYLAAPKKDEAPALAASLTAAAGEAEIAVSGDNKAGFIITIKRGI